MLKETEGTDSGGCQPQVTQGSSAEDLSLGPLSRDSVKEERRLAGALHPKTLDLAGQYNFELYHHSESSAFTDNHAQSTTHPTSVSAQFLKNSAQDGEPGF